MIFIIVFNKTALHLAIEKDDKIIIKYLISRPDLDINASSIRINYFYKITKFYIFFITF